MLSERTVETQKAKLISDVNFIFISLPFPFPRFEVCFWCASPRDDKEMVLELDDQRNISTMRLSLKPKSAKPYDVLIFPNRRQAGTDSRKAYKASK